MSIESASARFTATFAYLPQITKMTQTNPCAVHITEFSRQLGYIAQRLYVMRTEPSRGLELISRTLSTAMKDPMHPAGARRFTVVPWLLDRLNPSLLQELSP